MPADIRPFKLLKKIFFGEKNATINDSKTDMHACTRI